MVKRITIKDIAREVNLSLGTINKALNNKPGLSSETKQRVIATAERLGYKVNRVAQGLARNTIQIGIIMPQVWLQYYGYLKIGIDRELENLSDYNVVGRYYYVPDLHSRNETIEAFEQCLRDGMDAVIVCPAHENEYNNSICMLQSENIPVFVLGSDLEDESRLCCVRINATMSGMLAAEFMYRIIGQGRTVAVFIGNKDMSDHKEKADGFLNEARRRGLGIAGVYESHDEPTVAYHLTNKLVTERKDIGGFYVATANSVAVCKYIEEHAIEGMCVIGTDVSPEICDYMRKDIMQGVIFQDIVNQGRTTIKAVMDYLVRRQPIERNIFVTPQLLLKSNMDCYGSEYKVYHDLVNVDLATASSKTNM
jgi:LacI family transcriptional regulator